MVKYFKYFDLDLKIIILNAANAGVIIAWITEHLNSVGGFIVMLSVSILNLAKAYKEIKNVKNVSNAASDGDSKK
jgi:hypothetical protein